MIKQRMILGLMAASVTTATLAAELTWDGGGSDARWSTTNNWAGDAAVPVEGDALYFGGSSRLANTNDLSGIDPSFAGITFASGAGAFALWGNRLTLGGNVTNWSANTQTLNLPVVLSVVRDLHATNGAITVNGSLSGAGGLAKFGGQWLTLNASNSFDGAVTVNKGTLAVNHSSALGSTNGNTVVQGTAGGYLRLGSNLSIAEPLVLNGELNNGGSLNSGSGTTTNILSGPITYSGQARIQITSGTLVMSGGVTVGAGGANLVINSGATMLFNTTPLNLTGKTFYTDASGLTVLGISGNVWSTTMVAAGTLRLDVPNALPATATLQMGVGYQPGGTLNLNGNSQTTTKLFQGTTNAATRTITSPTPSLLTVNQSENTSFDGPFTGAAGLCKTGTGSLSLTNAASTTTGNFIVSNGTLVVTAASRLGNSTNIVVAGGTLELQNGTALSDAATVTVLDGGAKLKITTNLTETVSALFLGGAQQLRGTYGATSGADFFDSTHFSGGGILRVLNNPPITPTNYTWDAGGGADSNLTTAANWADDALPEFTGTSHVFFASSGSTATVNTNASVYGMTFNRDGAFTLANGEGALTLGLGGLTAAAPTATTRAYTLAEDVTLVEPQTWTVTNTPGFTTLTVAGSIGDGAEAFGITKLGNGALVLSGSNTFDGVTTNGSGSITVAHSNALGSTAGGTVVNTAGGTSARLDLPGGITLAEPLTFIGASVNGSCLQNVAGTNTVSGLITTTGGRYAANGGTLLNIVGGVTGASPFFVVNAQGTIAFTTTPLNLGTGTFHTDSGGLTVLGVAGNTWANTLFTGGTLRMEVANAFPTNSVLKIGGVWYGPNANLNLNGFDQTIGGLQRAEPSNGLIVITSPLPATLTVNQSANTTYDGRLAGAVSLIKAGTGSLTLSNALNSTSGNITVSNGTLVVFAATSLGNSTNVTVAAPASGTSTLTLQSSTAITNSAALTIANGGTAKISLASGVNESVGTLFFGTKQQRVGTYSASVASGAKVIDTEHFAGSGVLTVLRDNSGTLLRVQ